MQQHSLPNIHDIDAGVPEMDDDELDVDERV